MRNLLIGFVLAAFAAGAFLFKVQSDKLLEMARVEASQKREIDRLRKEVQALTDQAMRAKSTEQAIQIVTDRQNSAELDRERAKLQALIQQRQLLAATKSGDTSADDQARLKVLKDNLGQFEAQAKQDDQALKSVNQQSALAHENEKKARQTRKQARQKQIQADQAQLKQIAGKLAAINRRKNVSAQQNATDSYPLVNTQHQFENDIANLQATEQADQQSFNDSKQSYEASTHQTQDEIHGEKNGLNGKIAATKAEIATIQHRLEASHQQNSNLAGRLSDLDIQIKAEEGLIASMSATVAHPAAANLSAGAATNLNSANVTTPAPSVGPNSGTK